MIIPPQQLHIFGLLMSPSTVQLTLVSHNSTMGDFLLERDSDNTTLSVVVPDGNLTLHLYQSSILSEEVDTSTIVTAFNVEDLQNLPEVDTRMFENIICAAFHIYAEFILPSSRLHSELARNRANVHSACFQLTS